MVQLEYNHKEEEDVLNVVLPNLLLDLGDNDRKVAAEPHNEDEEVYDITLLVGVTPKDGIFVVRNAATDDIIIISTVTTTAMFLLLFVENSNNSITKTSRRHCRFLLSLSSQTCRRRLSLSCFFFADV